eukprot:jgi/Picsp_1/726/NSC_04215-R1_duf1295 domain-containing protein
MVTFETAVSSTVSLFRLAQRSSLSPKTLTLLLTSSNPVINTLSVTMCIIISVFILGFITDKYSWVDKIWSIAPVYYAWTFGLAELQASTGLYPRAAVVSCIITVWGVRLTYNFWRKGGYAWDGEDYRWPILKERMSPLMYQIFNFFFIAVIQNVLLTSLVVPVYISWYTSSVQKDPVGFNVYDAIGIMTSIICLIVEAVADQEQWDFHTRKANKRLSMKEKKVGFLREGLWAHSRHPNFFAEQSFWCTMCFFATAATGSYAGWWLAGPIALVLLFQGSTNFTEEISSQKYPEYREYQNQVSKLIPKVTPLAMATK